MSCRTDFSKRTEKLTEGKLIYALSSIYNVELKCITVIKLNTVAVLFNNQWPFSTLIQFQIILSAI